MFAEDLSQFFDLNGFAYTALITMSGGATRSVKAILNTPSQSMEIYDTNIETDAPHLIVKTSDAEGVRKGHSVNVNGKTYSIARKSDDGTGVSTLFLN